MRDYERKMHPMWRDRLRPKARNSDLRLLRRLRRPSGRRIEIRLQDCGSRIVHGSVAHGSRPGPRPRGAPTVSAPTHKVNSTGVSKKSVAVCLIERQEPSEPFRKCVSLILRLERLSV